MPNHVRNMLVIDTIDEAEGKKIEAFVKGVSQDNGQPLPFSLQQIRPLPAELEPRLNEDGTQMSGLCVSEEDHRRRTTLYGASDWYEWRRNNWGTKWEAYDQQHEEGSLVYEFNTAWTSPIEVIKYLSKKFPTSVFGVEYADEDLGNNCGSYSIKDGLVIGSHNGDLEYACNIWGYSYEEELEARQEDCDANEDKGVTGPAMCPECASKATWSNSSGELQCDECGYSETE